MIIQGILITQNDQEFIIGKATIKQILTYTKYTERLIVGYDERDYPIYNDHIQRKVESTRVNKIADFLINDPFAILPTNIVLGIPFQAIESQTLHDDIVHICIKKEVIDEVNRANNGDKNANIYITIVDGQHRIRGIEIAIQRLTDEIASSTESSIRHKLEKQLQKLLSMEVAISCFIDKSLEYHAMIFSTINRTQKRVSQDLVYSLFGLSSEDTPYKTALEITLALNAHPKSPFYHRIKLYGGDYDSLMSPPLSQATMIKSIVALISESLRESENDKYRKRKDLKKQNKNKFLPFRQFYANNQDNMISDCLFYFFDAVNNILSQFWRYSGTGKPQNILQSTVGYEALLSLLVDILEIEQIQSFDKETFVLYINKLTDINFGDTVRFPMTTKGKKIAYLTMSIAVFPSLKTSDNRKADLLKAIEDI